MGKRIKENQFNFKGKIVCVGIAMDKLSRCIAALVEGKTETLSVWNKNLPHRVTVCKLLVAFEKGLH